MAQHIFTGVTPPAFTPSGVGHHYVDTAAGQNYISVGTTSSADWKITSQAVDSVNGQTGVVVLNSSDVGAQAADATLTALSGYNTNGILTQTAPDTFAGRTISAGTGISVTNGDGVSGNPTISSTITQYTDELAQDAVGGALLATSSVNPTYNDGANQFSWDVLPGGVNHDALQNFVANEHVDHTSVSISGAANGGLGGGGDISANRTLNLDFTNLATMPATSERIAAADTLSVYDSSATTHKAISLYDFISEHQSLINQAFTEADDFIRDSAGGLTTTGNGAGNSTQQGSYGMDTVERALGISQTDTGTTTAGRRVLASSLSSLTTGLFRLRFGARVALEQLSNGTNTFTVTIGFINSAAAGDHTAGAYFRYTHSVNGGRWEAVTAEGGGSPTRAATDTGVLADILYSVFEVEIAEDTSNAKFYINGTLVATNSTNLPPTSVAANTTFGYGWKIEKSAGTTAAAISSDWYYYEMQRSSAR